MFDANSLLNISDYLSKGGASGLILLLLLILVVLIFERNRLLKKSDNTQRVVLENKEKELASVKEIIEKYHEGNMNLSRTLAEIRIVLEAIQRK